MRCVFRPEHPGAVAVIGGLMRRAGDEVEATEAEVARIAGLVPVAVAEFIDAVTTPNEHNPEADPVPVATPKKRGRPAKV